MVLQRSWSPSEGVGSLHPDSQRVDQVCAAAREGRQEELLGTWTVGSQIQNGGVLDFIVSLFHSYSPQDNEFELVFVIAYQKMFTLMYLDKLLDEIQLR